jgi:hypothetical protein
MADDYLRQAVWARAKNDELRTLLRGGSVSVADHIRALGATVVAQALLQMAEGTRFNDEDHSSGWFVFCSRVFRWSITDYGNKRELDLWF